MLDAILAFKARWSHMERSRRNTYCEGWLEQMPIFFEQLQVVVPPAAPKDLPLLQHADLLLHAGTKMTHFMIESISVGF